MPGLSSKKENFFSDSSTALLFIITYFYIFCKICPSSAHAMFKKTLLELQRYNQTKVNPRWRIKSKIEHALARYIKLKF